MSPTPTPAPPLRTGSPPGGSGGHWCAVGLALHAVWAVLLAGAVLLWVRVAFLGGPAADVGGTVRLLGAPFALLALAVLWWVWRSARLLRGGRREGWTLPLALGGVALVQAAVTGLPLLAAPGSAAPPGPVVAVLGTGAVLGTVSLVAAVLGRRAHDTAVSG